MSRRNPFTKRFDSVSSRGANLVVNRKSLNVELTKKRDVKIRDENLRFLQKL